MGRVEEKRGRVRRMAVEKMELGREEKMGGR